MIACSSVSVRLSTRGDSASYARPSVAVRRSRMRTRAGAARLAAGVCQIAFININLGFWLRANARSASRCRVQVRAHRSLGAVGVARLQRREDGQVLRQALVQPARRVQLLQSRQLDDLAQIADHQSQPAVVAKVMIASWMAKFVA